MKGEGEKTKKWEGTTVGGQKNGRKCWQLVRVVADRSLLAQAEQEGKVSCLNFARILYTTHTSLCFASKINGEALFLSQGEHCLQMKESTKWM